MKWLTWCANCDAWIGLRDTDAEMVCSICEGDESGVEVSDEEIEKTEALVEKN